MTAPVDAALAQLAALAGRDAFEDVAVSVGPPAVSAAFHADEAAAAALAAGAAEAAAIWRLRTGRPQGVAVDTREAAASLISFLMQRFEDPERAPVRDLPRTAAFDFYRARDGRFVYLHQSFDEGRGPLSVLGCEDTREAVGAAVAAWDAQALEDALAAAGHCGGRVRAPDEWDASDQGRRLAATPLVRIEPTGERAPAAFAAAPEAPLSGVKVLDLTRVLAGPACARALAGYGAEVLHVAGPDLPSVPPFVADTGHGKRSAFLDLKTREGRDRLLALAAEADVFVQGYRGGALDRLGLSPDDLTAVNPALIHVSINCYGHDGPWAGRPGWEQLAQAVSGMAVVQGGEESPSLLPAALNDYTTGYLAAFGAMVALRRRAESGGGARVQASLTRTAMWVRGLGLDPGRPGRAQPFTPEELTAWSIREDSGFGPLTCLRPPVALSETPARWTVSTAPLGTHPAAWT